MRSWDWDSHVGLSTIIRKDTRELSLPLSVSLSPLAPLRKGHVRTQPKEKALNNDLDHTLIMGFQSLEGRELNLCFNLPVYGILLLQSEPTNILCIYYKSCRSTIYNLTSTVRTFGINTS